MIIKFGAESEAAGAECHMPHATGIVSQLVDGRGTRRPHAPTEKGRSLDTIQRANRSGPINSWSSIVRSGQAIDRQPNLN